MMNEYKVQWKSLECGEKTIETKVIKADEVYINDNVIIFSKNEKKELVFMILLNSLDNIERR